MALHGDVAGALMSLADGLRDVYKCDSDWTDELRRRDDDKQSANRSLALDTHQRAPDTAS